MRVLATIILGGLLVACDNAIEPIVQGAVGELSVHGYLDTAADTQFVRLEQMRPSAAREAGTLSDLVVTTSDAQGRVQHWHHRPQLLDGGNLTDVYFSVFTPVPGELYRLRAESPAGHVTEATTTVPQVPVVDPGRPVGDTLHLVQNVRVVGVNTEPLRLTVLYEVMEPGAHGPVKVDVDYGRGGTPAGPDWLFDVFLVRDQSTVLTRLNRNVGDREVALVSIGVRAEILSQEWADPSESPNISSGRGFFGAIGRYDLTWSLETRFVETMGFVDAQ